MRRPQPDRHDDVPRTADREAISQAKRELDNAELTQFAAIGLLIAGVACVILGNQRVLPVWLAIVAGALLIAVAVVLFWRAADRRARAHQTLKQARQSSDDRRLT